eukprot:8531314-Ditylum_brightwellii.AAC.1
MVKKKKTHLHREGSSTTVKTKRQRKFHRIMTEIKLIEKPKPSFSQEYYEIAQRKINAYLIHPGDMKGGIKRKRAKKFVNEVVKVKDILSFELMLACVEALTHSTDSVRAFLFDEEQPEDAGCWNIFTCWLKKANQHIRIRRTNPKEKSLLVETEGKTRTEEQIVVALMKLIRVCCGDESEGKYDP